MYYLSMETGQRRLFLCIRVPENLADAISTLERQHISGSVKWQRNEKLHITIAFLGDCSDKEMTIRTAIRHALASKLVVPFSLAVHEVVACQTRTLRLLFQPVAQEGSIVQLRTMVHAALHETKTVEEDKDERTSISGHLTLARLKGVSQEWITAYVSAINAPRERPFCEWPRLHVKELCLMSSDSSGFHLVETFPLGD